MDESPLVKWGPPPVADAIRGSGGVRGTPTPANSGKTVGDAISHVEQLLTRAAIDDAGQEARDAIAVLLGVPRFWPSLNRHASLPAGVWDAAVQAADKRRRGAPFAYAVGRASFRHLTLDVDERVLIPRQETELLPEIVLDMVDRPGGLLVDVGTGSGALALALACEGAFDRVIATDVSLDALAVARRNAELLSSMLRAPVEFRLGAGLAPVIGETVRAIVANPPYIAFGEMSALPLSVRDWEPPLALCCGGNGMAVTADIVRSGGSLLEESGVLALEVDTRRASLVAELLASDGRFRDVAVRLDLTGRERFVVAHRK